MTIKVHFGVLFLATFLSISNGYSQEKKKLWELEDKLPHVFIPEGMWFSSQASRSEDIRAEVNGISTPTREKFRGETDSRFYSHSDNNQTPLEEVKADIQELENLRIETQMTIDEYEEWYENLTNLWDSQDKIREEIKETNKKMRYIFDHVAGDTEAERWNYVFGSDQVQELIDHIGERQFFGIYGDNIVDGFLENPDDSSGFRRVFQRFPPEHAERALEKVRRHNPWETENEVLVLESLPLTNSVKRRMLEILKNREKGRSGRAWLAVAAALAEHGDQSVLDIHLKAQTDSSLTQEERHRSLRAAAMLGDEDSISKLYSKTVTVLEGWNPSESLNEDVRVIGLRGSDSMMQSIAEKYAKGDIWWYPQVKATESALLLSDSPGMTRPIADHLNSRTSALGNEELLIQMLSNAGDDDALQALLRYARSRLWEGAADETMELALIDAFRSFGPRGQDALRWLENMVQSPELRQEAEDAAAEIREQITHEVIVAKEAREQACIQNNDLHRLYNLEEAIFGSASSKYVGFSGTVTWDDGIRNFIGSDNLAPGESKGYDIVFETDNDDILHLRYFPETSTRGRLQGVFGANASTVARIAKVVSYEDSQGYEMVDPEIRALAYQLEFEENSDGELVGVLGMNTHVGPVGVRFRPQSSEVSPENLGETKPLACGDPSQSIARSDIGPGDQVGGAPKTVSKIVETQSSQ